MRGKKEFVERLALLGIFVKEDNRFGLDALYNSEINEVTYNPHLLTQKKAVEILLYFERNKC